jgi:hypothetical protein
MISSACPECTAQSWQWQDPEAEGYLPDYSRTGYP